MSPCGQKRAVPSEGGVKRAEGTREGSNTTSNPEPDNDTSTVKHIHSLRMIKGEKVEERDVNTSANHSINQPFSKPLNQSINQSFNQ